MAKSIRSKWKRKCRAVKRERYGKKELDRLKKTLGIDEKDVNMTEIANVTDIKQIKKKQIEDNQMETDKKKTYNPKTLRDENGAHPLWLHPRKASRNKITKKTKQSKSKKGKKRKVGK